MSLSTHKVEVVPVTLEPHPNADSLSIVRVFGYTALVRTEDWKDGDLGAYVPPDSVVDCDRPEFTFLKSGTKTLHRVKAKKLRGIQSFGLLVKAPAGAAEGDDVAEILGVTHYEPEMKCACAGGEAEAAPGILSQLPKYDVDAMRRYRNVFRDGEVVLVTEKIHGANARYCWLDGRLWCGSRSEWKRREDGNLWWRAAEATPSIQEFCESNPGHVLYGEVYGQVQDLKYGTTRDEVRFAAFDVLTPSGEFADAWNGRSMCRYCDVPVVPLIGEFQFDFGAICGLAEGRSLVPGAEHVREGCVVKPLFERFHPAIGRVQLKVVGAGYLERK